MGASDATHHRHHHDKAASLDLFRRPVLAVETTALFLGCVLLYALALVATVQHGAPLWVGSLLATPASYGAFTVMHDAAHRSLSTSRFVNDSIGRMASFMVSPTSCFPTFRWIHLEHHHHTNDADKDPDAYAGRGPVWLLPLRWATVELSYYPAWFGSWSKHSLADQVETMATILTTWGCIAYLAHLGHFDVVFWLWLVPSRVALTWLLAFFDYIPHHVLPGEDIVANITTAKESRYGTTILLETGSWWIPLLLLSQDYHAVHHLYPMVPFARYAKVWRRKEVELIRRGVPVRFAFGAAKEM